MKFLLLVSLFVVAAVAAEDKLKVEVVFLPSDCTAASPKSKKDDFLSMHYTGTLTNGKKFDSRYCVPFIHSLDSSNDMSSALLLFIVWIGIIRSVSSWGLDKSSKDGIKAWWECARESNAS